MLTGFYLAKVNDLDAFVPQVQIRENSNNEPTAS